MPHKQDTLISNIIANNTHHLIKIDQLINDNGQKVAYLRS